MVLRLHVFILFVSLTGVMINGSKQGHPTKQGGNRKGYFQCISHRCIAVNPKTTDQPVYSKLIFCRKNCKNKVDEKDDVHNSAEHEREKHRPAVLTCPAVDQVRKKLPDHKDIHRACNLNLQHSHGECDAACRFRFGSIFVGAFCSDEQCTCVTCGSQYYCQKDKKCVPCTLAFDCPSDYVYTTSRICKKHCPFEKKKYYCDDNTCSACLVKIENGTIIKKECPRNKLWFDKSSSCDKFCKAQSKCFSIPFWTRLQDDTLCPDNTVKSVDACKKHCKDFHSSKKILLAACSSQSPGSKDEIAVRQKRTVHIFQMLKCFCKICGKPK